VQSALFPFPFREIKTVASVGATCTMLASTFRNAGDDPTISSNMKPGRFAS
jgi:hypothetical protein